MPTFTHTAQPNPNSPHDEYTHSRGHAHPFTLHGSLQDYAEANRAAKDLVKLTKLAQQTVEVSIKEPGKPRQTEIKSYAETGQVAPAKDYAERAVQEVIGASLALDAAVKCLP